MHALKNDAIAELRIWDKVCILVGHGYETGMYEARIDDIVNGGIIITNPELISGHTLLRSNVPVIVQFTREDAAYQFHSRIRVYGTDQVRRVILTPPSGFQRVQRRMFARVELAVRIAYSMLPVDSKWDLWQKEAAWTETQAVNISAAGMLMPMLGAVKAGDLIAVRLSIFDEAQIPPDLIAVCRRVIAQEGRVHAGFEFVLSDDLARHLSRTDLARLPKKYRRFDRLAQDRLVTYLFHKQIELKHKELI